MFLLACVFRTVMWVFPISHFSQSSHFIQISSFATHTTFVECRQNLYFMANCVFFSVVCENHQTEIEQTSNTQQKIPVEPKFRIVHRDKRLEDIKNFSDMVLKGLLEQAHNQKTKVCN